jgi:NAD(P)-dependent dehydrogenase (short-subunit alcohol dehydrogenase family)
MFSLTNKVAFVTGSGSGIGAAIAETLAGAGALVYVADRDSAGGKATVKRIEAEGRSARFVELDVTDEDACRRTIGSLLAAHGGQVDVLVNNAGVGLVGTILQTSAADFERLWSVNVKGMYFLCRAMLPSMIARRSGSIVNLASSIGVMGANDRFAYATTKHAVVGMTRCMALDHGESQVRINCICPGRVDTPFVQARLREYAEPGKFLAQMAAPHALKRMAQPEEIAAAALYLASDESKFVTGSCLMVDGGYTAGK